MEPTKISHSKMAAGVASNCGVHYRVITRNAALSLEGYRHAVHAMLHSTFGEERRLFGHYPVRNAVMLQMRFDGFIGFPGGFVEDGETLEAGLRRELSEELGSMAIAIDESHHVISHVCSDKPLCLHFYCKEIKLSVLQDIERRLHEHTAHDLETLGLIRCPLYTMRDGIGGLPTFLRHNFIGNAREQLMLGLKHAGLLSDEEISRAVESSGIPLADSSL